MRNVLLFLDKLLPLKVVSCFHFFGGVSIGYHLHPDPCVPQALNRAGTEQAGSPAKSVGVEEGFFDRRRKGRGRQLILGISFSIVL